MQPDYPPSVFYASAAAELVPAGVPAKRSTTRKKRKLPVWLSMAECARLLAAAASERDRLIILCGLYLGLRVSEICNLQTARIDLERQQVLIYQGKGGVDRYVPLHPKLLEPLAAWLRKPEQEATEKTEANASVASVASCSGFLFPSRRCPDQPIKTRTVQYLISKAAARAGITRPDPRQRISPHKLRHTFGSLLAERGADIVAIRDLMGHASVATTQVYLHAHSDRLRREVEKL